MEYLKAKNSNIANIIVYDKSQRENLGDIKNMPNCKQCKRIFPFKNSEYCSLCTNKISIKVKNSYISQK
jgi:rRNA maturation endonuclease Nob1